MIKQDFDTYKSSDGISASTIKQFRISPKYWKYMSEQPPIEPTRPMIIGSAVHCAILEPHLFNDKFVFLPNLDMRRTEDKKIFSEIKSNHPQALLLSNSERDLTVPLIDSIKNNEIAMQFFNNADNEIDFYGVDEITGLKIKGRIDNLPKFGNAVVDLKTCQSSTPESFLRDIINNGHHIQAVHYLELTGRKEFVFVAVEKSEPYTCSIFALDNVFLEVARNERRMILDLIKWSFDNNYYCDYNEFALLKQLYNDGNLDMFFGLNKQHHGVATLSIPNWYKY